MCYFVDLDVDLKVTFQGQKEKMLILSSGHLSFAHKTSGNVRKTLSTTAATPNTKCVGVTITTPSIAQNWLVNLVPAYSRTMFGDFGRFSNGNIFDEWLERHIRNICPCGT